MSIIIITNKKAYIGTEMGHKWIIYLVFVCVLTPLSLHSIFRCGRHEIHYCAFDKAVSECCSVQVRFKSLKEDTTETPTICNMKSEHP